MCTGTGQKSHFTLDKRKIVKQITCKILVYTVFNKTGG